MGQPPFRIEVLTDISGVAFADAWGRRVDAKIEGIPLRVIGLDDLLRNKRAAGRGRDLADVEALEKQMAGGPSRS